MSFPTIYAFSGVLIDYIFCKALPTGKKLKEFSP